MSIAASIFFLPEPSRQIDVRSLWAEMATDVTDEFPELYVLSAMQTKHRLILTNEVSPAADHKVIRYRVIEADIRRKPGQPTLLELSVGNLFSWTSASPPEPLHVADDPKYATWARNAAQIPLSDHVRLIRQFTADLMDTGWNLQMANLQAITIPPPQIQNQQRIQPLPNGKFQRLVQHPVSIGNNDFGWTVVSQDSASAKWVAERLTRSRDVVFGQFGQSLPPVRTLRTLSLSAVNLIILGDQSDLNDMPDLRNTLREAETAGIRFKLAKLSSLEKTYPAHNIAYDLFLIGGGKPWNPVQPQPSFCSLDAGHHKELAKSRWVRVETNEQQAITAVRVCETKLAEHMPSAVRNEMWPTSANAIICRDGRLLQEKKSVEARALKENRPLIECKKSPKAILWRESGARISPAEFGDAIIDDHDDVLLQTMSQDLKDYRHPIRLTMKNKDAVVELTTTFLHQHAMPGLSLYRMSRLPGALYFADLVSKLTKNGWAKAVGRGFQIPEVIP